MGPLISQEVRSSPCIEQETDRQGLTVCHALSRRERASISISGGRRTERLTEVCVRTYTLGALSSRTPFPNASTRAARHTQNREDCHNMTALLDARRRFKAFRVRSIFKVGHANVGCLKRERCTCASSRTLFPRRLLPF